MMMLDLLLKCSATFCWLYISAKMILLSNLQYIVCEYVMFQDKVWPI